MTITMTVTTTDGQTGILDFTTVGAALRAAHEELKWEATMSVVITKDGEVIFSDEGEQYVAPRADTLCIESCATGWTVTLYKHKGLNKGRTVLANVCGGALGKRLAMDLAKAASADLMIDLEVLP
jgi:hypothetical protein